MQDELEQRLDAFKREAMALADRVHQEGGGQSTRGPRGVFQAHVNVLPASPPHKLVGQLQDLAAAIGLYLNNRRIGRGEPPEG